MTVKVKLVNFEVVSEMGPRGRRIVREEATAVLERLKGKIVPRIKGYTPKFRGDLQRSIEGEVVDIKDGWMLHILPHGIRPVVANSVESGRKPGKMPPWGPDTPLGRWAAAKGIPAFLVARAIGRKGTIKRFGYRGARMFERGMSDSESTIAAEVKRFELGVSGKLVSGGH